MLLVEALLAAPDLDSVRRLAQAVPLAEIHEAVESMAGHVLKSLRVEPRRALEIADRAALLADCSPDEIPRARTRWVRGHALAGLQRNAEAVGCYDSAAKTYEVHGRTADVARIAIGQVNVLTYLGRYNEALQVGAAARETLKRTGQAPAAARMDLNLGNLYHRIEKPRLALRHYDRALRVARAIADPEMIRVIQLNRGTVLSALGKLDEAEKLYRKVGDEAAAAGETRIKAFVDFNLGYILFQRGEYGPAYDTLDAARQAFERLEDDHFLALTWIDIAELLLEVNGFRRAAEAAEEACRVAEKLSLRFELARATLYAAIAHLGEDDLEGARARLLAAAELFHGEGNEASQAVVLTHLAEIETRQGRYEEAEQLLGDACAVFKRERMPIHEGTALVRRGANRRMQGRLAEARVDLAAAGRAARRARTPWVEAQVLHESGRVARDEGKRSAAKRLFRRAIERVESIRGRIGIDEFRVSFAQDKAPLYGDLVQILLSEPGRRGVEEAFAVAERARSRALCDLLAGRLSPDLGGDEGSKKLLARLETLRQEINRLTSPSRGASGQRRATTGLSLNGPVVKRREAEMSEILRRLERRNSRVGALTCGETLTLEEVRGLLPADATLVEYFLGPRESWAFVVRREGARVVPLRTTKEELERHVTLLRFQIEKMGYGDEYAKARRALISRAVEHHLAELAKTLWHGLDIPEGRVVIVPHGPLHSIPFAAFPLPGGGHLVDRYGITVLPSASCSRYFADRAPASSREREPRVLAVAAGDDLIPEAVREVDEVHRTFRRGKLLRRGEATRAAFRKAASNADVIHIATHAVFRTDDPSFSSLQMADGWMGLHEIFALRLKARLVCLSACQSGRNWVGPGDELVGLSRGFLHAGAGALLVSLWPVNDAATATLMVEFYRRLRDRERPDEALRQAMIEVRKSDPEPVFWASFALVGGGDVFSMKSPRPSEHKSRGVPLRRARRSG